MIKKISIILGIFGAVVLVTVLGYTVWRTMQPQSTITFPKAAGREFAPARRAKPLPPQSSLMPASKVASILTANKVLAATSAPTDGHYISDIYLDELFVTGGGTTVTNASAGFEYLDGSCQWTVAPPTTATINNNQFSLEYNGYALSGTFDTTNNSVSVTTQYDNYSSSDCGNGATGGPFTDTLSLSTCSSAGYASCNGTCKNVATDSQNCGSCGNVCTSNQHCSGGFCVAGTVTGNGQCVAPSQTHLACGTNNTCVRKLGAGSNVDGCTAVGGSCGNSNKHFECVNKTCASVNGSGSNKNGCASAGGTCCTSGADCSTGQSCDSTKVPNTCATISNEANVCWGNGGTGTNAGRCYDCNGDGTVNILDFSCFRLNWLKPVQ